MKIAKTAAMVLALGIVFLGAGAAANLRSASSPNDGVLQALGKQRPGWPLMGERGMPHSRDVRASVADASGTDAQQPPILMANPAAPGLFAGGPPEDCNGNGIPDPCDIDCGVPGGPCDLPGCGQSDDCNGNGVPDICDMGGPSVALDFDGVDDQVRVPRTLAFEPTDELTVEVWIRPDSAGSYHSRIVRIAGHFGPGYILAWQQSGDRRLQLRIDGATQGGARAEDTVPTDAYFGQWIHAAGVYSATGNFCRLYVNGFLKADVPGVGTMRYAGSDLFFGNFITGSGNEDFDGLIDEVRIWNVARSEQEIRDHMASPLAGNEPGLVGYWRFNEGSGQLVMDSTAHGNHGFLGYDSNLGGDIADPLWLTPGAPMSYGDCNGNGIPDECDIASGSSQDCNTNGMPDECETDCNHNGLVDECDIASGSSQDCNTNGTPDECDLGQVITIRSGNGAVGSTDPLVSVLAGPANSGFAGAFTPADFEAARLGPDANIVPPEYNYIWPLPADPQAKWITTVPPGHTGLFAIDFEVEHFVSSPATLDLFYSVDDYLGNGSIPGVYINGLAIPGNSTGGNHFNQYSIGGVDVASLLQVGTNTLYIYARDAGGPGAVVFSATITMGGTSEDCNVNGVVDECDIASGVSADCNENGIPDECEFAGTVDCNANGVIDLCEPGGAEDCNDNDVSDWCDIANGTSDDCNGNGVPDICDMGGPSVALDFDGVDDQVRVPRTLAFEPTDELTVEVWIRPDSAGSYHSRIVRIAGHFGPGYILAWQQSGDRRLQLRIDGATQGGARAADTVPTDAYFGQWIHAAGVYSATGSFCRLYVNGFLKADVPGVGTMRYAGSDLFFGNFITGSGNEDFDGLIDEVRIWNIARTEQEIRDNMDSPLTGSEPGLVGYWRFNEGSGQLVMDSTSFGNHGFLGYDNDPAGDSADPLWLTPGAPMSYGDCNGNGILDECDIADGTSQDCNGDGTPDECEAEVVPCGVLDVKPGGCPNPLNRSSQGYLPMALAGTVNFDVTLIDVASVRLSRADGVGGEVAPNEGPPGPHSVFADVATPFEGVPCDCHDLSGDGLDDLSMKFRTQAVVAALHLGGLSGGDEVEWVITGTLLDGTAFTTGGDCILIVPVENTGVRAKAGSASQAERPVFGRGMGAGHRP